MKTLVAAALVSGAVVLTGWGAISFAGLTVGLTESSGEAAQPRPAADSPVATAAISRLPASREASAIARDRGFNALLFNPQLIAPPPGPATPPATGAPEAAASSTAVPQPPPQASQNDGAANPRTAATRAQRPPRDNFRGPFTQSHIARIKQRLRLTREQEELWAPVEAALKRIAQRQQGGGVALLDATESQNLYWAAGPLIMSLRPDQREEARNLARSMGLETVASLL